MEGKDGRTEFATQRKREDERRKGNLCVSQEVTSLCVLLLGVVALRYAVPTMFAHIHSFFTGITRFNVHEPWTIDLVCNGFATGCLGMAAMMAPFLVPVMLGSVIGNMVQTGPFFSMEAWKMGFSNMSPTKGMKQLCSTQAVGQLFMGVLKMVVVVLTAYLVCHDQVSFLIGLQDVDLISSARWLFLLIYRLALMVCVAAIVIAAVDWIMKKRQYEKSIMMTKQEIRDEFRQQEASPLVRKAMMRRMRQMTVSRMMAAVPNASVIITNPDHVAVAIEYDAKTMSAPKVTAKGVRLMAERIKKVARENNVPIVRRPETARALYKYVKVGHPVPSQFFRAVAEILAYLHKLGRHVGLKAS
jgi:flagellar biosynthetic protein FlhB